MNERVNESFLTTFQSTNVNSNNITLSIMHSLDEYGADHYTLDSGQIMLYGIDRSIRLIDMRTLPRHNNIISRLFNRSRPGALR